MNIYISIYIHIYIYIYIYISGMYKDRNGTEMNEKSWNGPVFLERNGQQQETYPLNPERLEIVERQDRNGWNSWNVVERLERQDRNGGEIPGKQIKTSILDSPQGDYTRQKGLVFSTSNKIKSLISKAAVDNVYGAATTDGPTQKTKTHSQQHTT